MNRTTRWGLLISKTAVLDWYSSYVLNKTTGTLTLPSTDSIAANRPATASSTADGSSPGKANDRDYNSRWIGASAGWPATWQVDLGSARHVSEIDITWPMVKGSEAYYKYRIELSTDGNTYTTYDHTDNKLYGFTSDSFNTTARYIRVRLDSAVIQNSSSNWYSPGIYHVRVLP